MRSTSMGLGIAGGCVALVLAVLLMLGGAMLTYMLPGFFGDDFFDELESYEDYDDAIDMDLAEDAIDFGLSLGGSFLWIFGGILALCAAAGIVCGIIVKKQNVAAGIVMLVGGILALVTVVGILPGLLLIAGGIFALVKEKKVEEPPVPIQA